MARPRLTVSVPESFPAFRDRAGKRAFEVQHQGGMWAAGWGAFLAQAVASVLDVELYYTERFVSPEQDALYPVKYRIPNGLRNMAHGKDVAIVDDVINAGSAVCGTFAELKSCGAKPVAIGALLVLGYSDPSFCSDQNIPLECIAYLPSNLWAPSECPLCSSQTPLEDISAERPTHSP